MSIDGCLRVEMFDGNRDEMRKKDYRAGLVQEIYAKLTGESCIVEMITQQQKVYAVYDMEDGGYIANIVPYLALYADGEVRGFEFAEGEFQPVSSAGNFVGIFTEKEMQDAFPHAEIIER